MKRTHLIYFLIAVYMQDQCTSQCSNCRFCNNWGCTSCNDGFYMVNNRNYNYCFQCSFNCISCADYEHCISCSSGYYRYNNYCYLCRDNCLSCTDRDNCNSCKPGNYGTKCDLRCSIGCQGGVCYKETGTCITCSPGFTGSQCDTCLMGYYKDNNVCHQCSKNCISCTDWNNCIVCQLGYYGSQCHLPCSSGCHGSVCTKLTGSCSCYETFVGNNCDDCKVGYYRSGNLCYQCPVNCIFCREWNQCSYCQTGYYGLQCTLHCSSGCPGTVCNKETGACICSEGSIASQCDTCRVGYYGNECRPCSYGCEDDCDKHLGTCRCKPTHTGPLCERCVNGSYGLNCEQQCRQSCKSCTDGNTCLECMDGYRDKDCSAHCSEGCVDNVCRQNDAFCTGGCKHGYSGAYCCLPGMFGWSCEQQCSTNCNTCTSLTACQSCKDGFYGSTCNEICHVNCNTCTSQMECTACKNGYTGKTCQIKCPQNCLTCSNGGECVTCEGGFSNPDIGCQCLNSMCSSSECISCVNSTYYAVGSTCCPCNSNCKHGTCTSASQCTDGCEDGLFGPKCGLPCSQIDPKCYVCSGNSLESYVCKRCTNGHYPDTNRTCVQCSALCVKGQCNSSNGFCEKGCTDGFWNSSCDQKCIDKCTVCNRDSGDCLNCSFTNVFGAHCDMPCSSTCFNASCHINGTCTNGCITDYYGPSCEQSCPTSCAHSINGSRCSLATGSCLFGCNEGFQGEGCTEALKLDNTKNTVTAAAIGGGVAAVVVVAFVVVVGLFIFFRRRSRGPKNETIQETPNNASNSSAPVYAMVTRREHPVSVYKNTTSVKANKPAAQVHNPVYTNSRPDPVAQRDGYPITTENSLEIDEWDSIARQNAIIFEENGGVYYNNNEKVKTLKIPVAELQKFVMSKNKDYFKKEFEKLPYGLLKEYRVSQMKANIGKNRYKGIYPYDDHRVKVRSGDTDYINASFIDGYKRRNEYVATLGPMSKQLGDFAAFWRMVWQQNVEKIVMVTNLVEEGKDKCEKYWPSVGDTQMYGDIQVVCQSEDEYAEFTRRTYDIIKERQTRTLTQLHFTSWPDKDVPEDVTSIIEFRQNVICAPATLGGPTIVHCSAGVGRTGTYIAIDILTKEGEAEGTIDIPGCVLNMRQNRPNMVQTAGQYAYLHHAVVHSLTFDCKPVASDKFQLYMDTTSMDKIRDIFHQLQETASCGSSDETEAVARNATRTDKNREGTDVPGDEHRPKLYLNRKPGSTDYVNAVYVNSLKKKKKYVVAQTPLPNTVGDFLALLVQTNCACIVSLESANMNAGDIGVYLPADNQALKNGIFTVRCSKPEANEYRNKRTLTIEHRANQANESLSVTYLEFTDWNTEGIIPNSPSNFRRFIAEVDAVTANNSDRPVLMHCLDGADKCGLFCVVATLLQKMEAEHEVNVANAVRKVRTRRKSAIPNFEQFQFCHDCVLDYIQSFNIYCNIAAELSDC